MDDETTLAGQPLDDIDAAILDLAREAYGTADPVPPDLAERVHFAVALDAMFDEVAEITRVPLDALAARGEPTATRTETLTFSAERVTAMVTVTRSGTRSGGGGLRLEGWLAPPQLRRVSLRLQGGAEVELTADEQGGFSCDDLDEGFAQLRFFDEEDPAHAVVTPVFEL